MVANEDRMKVLKMIHEGKLTPDEGMELLDALDDGTLEPQTGAQNPPQASKNGGRWLRVRVADSASGKVRVNVRLPLSIVRAGLKMGARFSPELNSIDVEQFEAFINAGEIGPLVDVQDDEDGEHVQVSIE